MKEFKCDKKWTCILFGIIAAVNLFVYFPSFKHIPRADHIFYLADMAYKHDWYSLAIRSFDWSRSRTFAVGDSLIFRPVAYFLMGTEKYLFGYNFIWWQVTGLVLHLLVVWALLKLLLNIHRGFFAFLLAAYFSLLFMNMETVIWHAVNSILVAVLMILISLNQIYEYACKGQTQMRRLILATFCMTVASFTYEISAILSGLFFIFLFITVPYGRTGRWRSFLLLLPPVLFSAVSIFHYFASGIKAANFVQSIPNLHIVQAIKHAFLTMAWWSYSSLFSGQYQVVHKLGRAILSRPAEIFPPVNIFDPQFLLGFFFVLCWGLIVVKTAGKEFLRRRWKFLALLLSMVFCWAMLISAGRVQERGIASALGGTLMYHYIFLSFVIVLFYAVINFENIRKDRFAAILRNIFLGLLLAQTVFNGVLIYEMNCRIAKWYEPNRKLIRSVESLIKQQGKNPEFSFYIDPKFPGNFLYPYSLREEHLYTKRYSFAELIYLNHFDLKNPKYIFVSEKYPGGPKILVTK